MDPIKLLFDDSLETIEFAAKKCCQHPELMTEMLDLSMKYQPIYSYLAAKVVSSIFINNQVHFRIYKNTIIDNFQTIKDENVKVLLLNIFVSNPLDLDNKYFILLSQHCFRELDRAKQNEDLKIICLEILKKLAVDDEDLRSELFWLSHEISFLGSESLKQKSGEIIKGLFTAIN